MILPASCLLLCHLFIAFGDAKRIAHIYIPSVVQAGTSVEATITVDYNPLSNATYASGLRLYLASSPFANLPPEFHQSQCELIPQSLNSMLTDSRLLSPHAFVV